MLLVRRLGRKTINGRRTESKHAFAGKKQTRLTAVHVFAVRLQCDEHVDKIAGLNLVADTHDLVGLDGNRALAFSHAKGKA
ncbi:hypothetical protein D3C85_1310340 [compost metagenome]